jgi:hypothetical protein
LAPLIFAVITLASWALRPPSRVLGEIFFMKQSREAPAQRDRAPVSG